jgi:hypothetical protein
VYDFFVQISRRRSCTVEHTFTWTKPTLECLVKNELESEVDWAKLAAPDEEYIKPD